MREESFDPQELSEALDDLIQQAQSFFDGSLTERIRGNNENERDLAMRSLRLRFWGYFSEIVMATYRQVAHSDTAKFIRTVRDGDVSELISEYFNWTTAACSIDDNVQPSLRTFESHCDVPMLLLDAGDRFTATYMDTRSDIEAITVFAASLQEHGVSCPMLELRLLHLAILHEKSAYVADCIFRNRVDLRGRDAPKKFQAVAGAKKLLDKLAQEPQVPKWLGIAHLVWFFILLGVLGTSISSASYAVSAISGVLLLQTILTDIARRISTFSAQLRNPHNKVMQGFHDVHGILRASIVNLSQIERAIARSERSGCQWPQVVDILIERLRPYSGKFLYSGDVFPRSGETFASWFCRTAEIPQSPE